MIKNKRIFSLVFAVITLVLLANNSKAATLNPEKYFGITDNKEIQNNDGNDFGYSIGNPGFDNSMKLWEILEYSNSEGNNAERKDIYCVKAGVGFDDFTVSGTIKMYDTSYNLKTEVNSIILQNDLLKSLVIEERHYGILGLADVMYVLNSESEMTKEAFLEKAGIEIDYNWYLEEGYLSEAEIEVVQQAAMWYFTNYDVEDSTTDMYNKIGKVSWLKYKEGINASYMELSDYDPTNKIVDGFDSAGKQKEEQAQDLYEYLIEQATIKALEYKNANSLLDVSSKRKVTIYVSSENNNEQPLVIIEDEDKEFDLALRKYITKVNDVSVSESRVPNIDESQLINGNSTTATYSHKKDPVTVETGDIVTYNLEIFNEGEAAGRALEVIDQLPTGLEFVEVVSGNFELKEDVVDNKVVLKRIDSNTTNLPAYESGNLSSETIVIKCRVTQEASQENSIILTNVAYISDFVDEYGNKNDIDSQTDSDNSPNVNQNSMTNYIGNSSNKSELSDSNYFYKGEQDDDDFEKLVILPKEFDLKLIKRIVEINSEKVTERIENVDITKLANGTATTADYTLNKTPVSVKNGDLVTYTFRIYNEGELDGYAAEITEDIPTGLKFLGSNIDEEMNEITDEDILKAVEFNTSYGWTYVEGESSMIKTDYLAKDKYQDLITAESNLIKAFDPDKSYSDTEPMNPDYREVSVILQVVAEDGYSEIIRNEAAITKSTDEDGEDIKDRDSSTDTWVKYEDDEDYDNVILKEIDLALRKFITAVSSDETIEIDEYLKDESGNYLRGPVVDFSKLNTFDEDGKLVATAIYEHTKEPVLVQKNDVVIYMLRVYNEGELNVHAGEITDYLPEELEFVDGTFNGTYGWVVSEDGRIVKTEYLKDSLLEAFDGVNLDYVEVPIMCRVKGTAETSQIITNIAEVSKYLDENKSEVFEDRDSEPENVVIPSDDELPEYKSDETDSYIPGQQDDDDFERVIVKEFNLALRKWVTQGIVINNGQETIYESGNTPEMDPEPPVKIEIHKNDFDEVEVKFNYSIRVYNVGEIEGYALEVKDYIPDGLMFVQSDNPTWEVIDEKTVVTDALKDTLLQPGEYADVKILLTWEKDEDNMGLKTNTAEISKDDNEFDLPDINSTPDNKVEGEDDIDTAPVLLSVATGQSEFYFALGLAVLIIITSGTLLIKRYVLE